RIVWTHKPPAPPLPPILLKKCCPSSVRTLNVLLSLHRASRSAFLAALALFLPLFQQLDDGVLHLFGRVRPWKIFPQHIVFDGHAVHFGLLFLSHDVEDGIVGALAFLAQLLDALSLGKRRGVL